MPFLPKLQPHPAQAVLCAQLATIRTALAAAQALTAPPVASRPVVAALRTMHADQDRALQERLRQLGTPDPQRCDEDNQRRSPPSSDSAGLLAAEGSGVDTQSRMGLAQVPNSDRAMISSLVAQRTVAWWRLGPAGARVGIDTSVAAVPGPDGRSLMSDPGWKPSTELAVRLAPAAAAARYGVEVVAARASPTQEQTARTGLAAASDHAGRLDEAARVGGHPRVPELGYALPFPVASTADVARLARHVWTGWAQAVVSALVPLPGLADAPSGASDGSGEQRHGVPGHADVPALVGWLAEAELMRQRWHAPAVPFPGMRWQP